MTDNQAEKDRLTQSEIEALAEAAHCAPDKQIMATLAPAIEQIVQARMAQAWDEAVKSAHLHESENWLGIKHPSNPYRLTRPVNCDTCADTGRVPWMVEGDPNCHQEPDGDGTVRCLDCRPSRPAITGDPGGAA